MSKDRRSITIDQDVNKGIEEEAKKQRLNFSILTNRILSDYLMAFKKTGNNKKIKLSQ